MCCVRTLIMCLLLITKHDTHHARDTVGHTSVPWFVLWFLGSCHASCNPWQQHGVLIVWSSFGITRIMLMMWIMMLPQLLSFIYPFIYLSIYYFCSFDHYSFVQLPRTDSRFIAKVPWKVPIFNTGRWCPGVGGGRGPPLVITEVWSTPPLSITVMPRGVEVGPYPWDCLRGILGATSCRAHVVRARKQ